MVIFDLREEARQISLIYLIAPAAFAFAIASLAPPPLRARMPAALAEATRPLALVFGLTTGLLGWVEFDERRQADALVELCLNCGCTVAEGPVHDIEPVRKITSGGRFNAPMRGGYFKVGGKLYAHSPRESSDYSPANFLREGELVRIYSQDEQLVLVEVLE